MSSWIQRSILHRLTYTLQFWIRYITWTQCFIELSCFRVTEFQTFCPYTNQNDFNFLILFFKAFLNFRPELTNSCTDAILSNFSTKTSLQSRLHYIEVRKLTYKRAFERSIALTNSCIALTWSSKNRQK